MEMYAAMTKLINKVIIINKRRTSMRLCLEEWKALDEICKREKLNRNKIIEKLEAFHDSGLGLTYMTRLFMLMYYHDAATEALLQKTEQQPRAGKILTKIEKLPRPGSKKNSTTRESL